jgi:hypothetical protein
LDVHEVLQEIPLPDAGEKDWRNYEALVREQIHKSQKSLHLRRRVKWKLNMKKWKREREAQRKKQHEVRKYYNYALMRPTAGDKPTVLHEKDDTGEMQIIEGKKKFTEKRYKSPKTTWEMAEKGGTYRGRSCCRCMQITKKEKT